LDISDLKDRYDPTFADNVKNRFNKYATEDDLKAYFNVWLKGLVKHPVTYIESTLNNTFGYYYPNTYRLGINYHEGKWNANAWLRYGSGCDTTVDQYGYGNYADSSYLTVDVAVTYKATEDLSFYAKGYNLFNEAYAEFAGTTNGSYDYPAQSRRFIVGAEYKF
jgi:outer membrane receptor protein involved in Fe transport